MHINHACAQDFHSVAVGLKWKRKPLDLVECQKGSFVEKSLAVFFRKAICFTHEYSAC